MPTFMAPLFDWSALSFFKCRRAKCRFAFRDFLLFWCQLIVKWEISPSTHHTTVGRKARRKFKCCLNKKKSLHFMHSASHFSIIVRWREPSRVWWWILLTWRSKKIKRERKGEKKLPSEMFCKREKLEHFSFAHQTTSCASFFSCCVLW